MAHALRLSRLFTPTYAARINAQVVYPATSVIVKPNELESALARPLQTAMYEPERDAPFLAATLSYGIMKGHPFLDGNKRTAFFLANEYVRAHGIPGLIDMVIAGEAYKEIDDIVERFVKVASGSLDLEKFASSASIEPTKTSENTQGKSRSD